MPMSLVQWTYGPKIASTLESHGGKGTFFVNGNNYGCIYDRADDLIKRYKAGHLIGSHTWTHADITTLTTAQLNEQITLVETALMKILGIKPKYFRPPYGSYNDASVAVLAARGYKVATWNFDSGDSDGKTASQSVALYSKLYAKYPKPYMALNHETYASTGNTVMPTVIPKLVKAGYKLVTVAQCLGDSSPYQKVGTPGKRDKTWTCAGTPQPGPN
ncbi:carbohydrate esterase family 4 protein [Pseudohyphozyma bogoriensis]|nr:carbohydrate esterase family 4 protein [Pseudohyphozyma bogoriensis]